MVSLQDIAAVVARPLLSVAVGSVLAVAAQFLYGHSLSPIFRLMLGGGILVVAYLLMLLFVMGQKAFYLDLMRGVWPRPSAGEKGSVA